MRETAHSKASSPTASLSSNAPEFVPVFDRQSLTLPVYMIHGGHVGISLLELYPTSSSMLC